LKPFFEEKVSSFQKTFNLAMSQLSVDLLEIRTWRKLFVKGFLQTSFKNFQLTRYMLVK